MSEQQQDIQSANGQTMSEKPSAGPNGADMHPDHQAREQQSEQKSEKQNNADGAEDAGKKEEKQPEGGYDSTPVPSAPPGYTIKITFHRATNLPMADLNTLSSDPFIVAQINTSLQSRHKEDPHFRMRTPTVRRNTDPEWNFEWIVANVPASGFKLKCRVYDEDPADHDDRLGNVHVLVPKLDENWSGVHNQPYKIMKKSGSKRAYFIRAVAACMSKTKHMNGDLYISIEMLGRTEGKDTGRLYTVGPCWSIRHYSPMLGRVTGRKESDSDEEGHESPTPSEKQKKKTEKYNFQANQMQFSGPIPAELYHRYVEFKPWVKSMFTHTGIRGFLLSKALHHQHARVYNFDRYTTWGHYPEPGPEMTKAFLDLVHYDKGGRIFTYVLTLDSLWRFTETGKEFGIDMLSKHTMHSDVSIYIAFSGEFFVRRLKHGDRPPPPDPVESSEYEQGKPHAPNETHPPNDVEAGPAEEEPTHDPAHYELVIDNDSGTYRPNAKLLPLLKQFLARSLPGLHILTLDCTADADKMNKMKQEQRDRKKKEGDNIVYKQHGGSRRSSISSSDESDLDDMVASGESSASPERGLAHQLKQDVGLRGKAHLDHLKQNYPGHDRSRGLAEKQDQGDQDRGQASTS
ncbi:hypothetical protein MBLNU459_g8360t1 [Dothideomycetes sp. NU459]